MPEEYILKTDPLSEGKCRRIVKKLLKDGAEDRILALSMHEWFKARVIANPDDDVSKKLMVDCLKLAQTSQEKTSKLILAVRKTIKETKKPLEDIDFTNLLDEAEADDK